MAAVFLLFFPDSISAQIQYGQFTGVVMDSTGAVIAEAEVSLTHTGTGLTLRTETNAVGLYIVQELPVGEYRIMAEAAGFEKLLKTGLILNAGTVQRVDFQLSVGQHAEVVEVIGGATPVQTESPKLFETVAAAQIANLPLNGRNVYDLIQLAPGAVNVRGVMFETGTNTVVNGVRENFNGFVINGVSNKNLNSGDPVNQPIQDTVEEFQLLTLNLSAEFGNSAGSITNLVTKAGTNNLHGSAWWSVRNDMFDANQFFLNRVGEKKLALRFNQFGATFGGPVKRDKLFFFAAYQGERLLTTAPAAVVYMESQEFRDAVISASPNSIAALLYKNFPAKGPTKQVFTLDDYLDGGFSGSLFSTYGEYLCPAWTDGTGALANKFAKLFGVTQTDINQMNQPPDDGGCPGGSPFSALSAGAFGRNQPFFIETVTVPKTQTQPFTGNLFHGNEASLRLDYNFSGKDRAFAQMNWARRRDDFGTWGNWRLMRGFASPSKATTPNLQISYVHTFSPTLLNEVRLGYAGNDFGDDPRPNIPLGVPSISFDDGGIGFGAYQSFPSIFRENIYTYADMVSISTGQHTLKAGLDVRRNLENSHFDIQRPSYYFFDSLFFAADAPYEEDVGVDPGIVSHQPAHLADNFRHWRNWEFGVYLQDSWKASRRLTLNLGMRYDLFTRHTELNNLATTFLLGSGHNIIDDLSTGAGRMKDANIAAGLPGCDTPEQMGLAQLAGICGPGGFAPAKSLGAGDHNDFSPRIGFAWDVFGTGKTALRGGFGISYEGTLYNPLSNARWNLPYYSVNTAGNFLVGDRYNIFYGPQTPGQLPRFTGPPDPANFQGVGASAIGNLMGWDPSNPNGGGLAAIVLPEGLRDPYVMNWFLGVQHELAANLVAEVNYVATAGRKLFRAEEMNNIPGGRLPEGTCVIDNFGRKLCSQVNSTIGANGDAINWFGWLNPNYARLRVWKNVATSNYHSLQFSARRRMRRGFMFSANYTWSHSIDSGSDWHPQVSANGPVGGEGFFTDPTQPWLDRGNSVFDIRHRLALNYVWELPFFQNRHGFLGTVFGGWQLNGIWAYQTGAHWSPFDSRQRRLRELVPGACAPDAEGFMSDPANCVNVGGDYNLNGLTNDRPNAAARNVEATKQQWANGFNLPKGFFTTPCLGCVGNVGRNTFVGPNYWNVDISVFKTFRVTERAKLQFRAEAFNVFNRTNFQLPGSNFVFQNRIELPNFGQAGATFNPRELQFGLKMSF